jgi:MFS family permease
MQRQYAPLAGLAVVGLGASLAAMDLAVNVAFPSITAAFGLETRSIRWVVICYVLTYSGLMLAFGRLGDRVGHKRVFRAGLLVSAVAFVLCALAPDYPTLLAARVVQGVGTALTLSCAPALATLLFDESRRLSALGRYASLTALASVAAPLVGGLSIAALGWSGVFWFRAPLALLALALMPLLAHVHQPPASIPRGAPILPRALTRDPDFVLPNLAGIAVYFVYFAVPLLVPYYLTRIAGYSPLEGGCVLALSPAGVLLGSALAARTASRLGVRRTALLGGALVAAGSLTIALWSSLPSLPLILGSLLLHGVGVGLFQVAYADIVVAALPRGERGVAGSLTMVTRTIGVLSAATALTALLHAIEMRRLAAGLSELTAFADAFTVVFVSVAALLAAFFALTAVRRVWRGG